MTHPPRCETWAGLFCLATCLLLLFGAEPVAALECEPGSPSPARLVAPERHAESLLWELRSREGRVSHLFGTLHLPAALTGQPGPVLSRVLGGARALWLEVVLDEATLARLAQYTTLATDSSLSELLGRELFEAALDRLGEFGIDPEAAERLKPWVVYTTLSLPPESKGAPLDLVLFEAATRAGIPVHGLERIEEQAAVFDATSLRDQIALIKDELCHQEASRRETAQVIAAYRAGDLGALQRHALGNGSAAEERLRERLVDDRNRRMASRLMAPLTEGGALVAVGALHLPGSTGLIALLEARGFAARPLPLH